MKKVILLLSCGLVVALLVTLVRVPTAAARSTYFKAFETKYVGDKQTETQKALAAEVLRVKRCNVCHDPTKDENGRASKKNRNPYGQELAKSLSKKDQKNREKALEVLTKVEKVKAKGAEMTFGERILSGKLPVDVRIIDAE